MAAVLLMFIIFTCFQRHSLGFNSTVSDPNRTRLDWVEAGDVTGTQNSTLEPFSAAAEETVEPTADTELPRAATADLPLPLSGDLPAPVTTVSDLCPCDLQSDQCDINCCCDLDCSEELGLFTRCSVQKITGDPRLCSQDAALYTLSTTSEGLSQVQKSVQRELNSDVFCIQSTNYQQGLSFITPKTPTEENFDYLFSRFVGFSFGASGGALQTPVQGNSPGYMFGDVIQTQDMTGRRSFRLPASSVTANCLDTNPAAFLQDQMNRCVRSFSLAEDCTTSSALNMRTYINFSVYSGKDTEANLVDVGVESVTLQSTQGTRTSVEISPNSVFQPEFLKPAGVCNQVVLQVRYVVRYGEAGQIVRVNTVFVLGAVNSDMLPLQQEFHIIFIQEGRSDGTLRSSGNPGYVVGRPLVAGWRTAEWIIQSSETGGSLSVLQSSADQNCLSALPHTSPVLFGRDVLTGCVLRLEDGVNCSLVTEAVLGRLKGQNSPDHVASFGNSSPQNLMDWVPIENQTLITGSQGCSVPVSYHLQVKWTKYGALVNPQAQIVSVMEIVTFNSSTLPSSSTGGAVVPVISSVSFIDVSAEASPGFRAPPTINAKLPFDFFFPFV